MRQFIRSLKRWIKQTACAHERKELTAIVRDPASFLRLSQYTCPDCDRRWIADDLPEGWLRNASR